MFLVKNWNISLLNTLIRFDQISQKNIMGKGIVRWPYLPPNSTFVVPQLSASSPQNYSTKDYGAAINVLNQP